MRRNYTKMMARDTTASHTKWVATSVGGTPGSSASPSPTTTPKSERPPITLALEACSAKRKADEFERQNGSVSSRRPEKSEISKGRVAFDQREARRMDSRAYRALFDNGGFKKQKKASANNSCPPSLGTPSIQGNMRISGLSAPSASLTTSSRSGLSDNSPEAQEVRSNKVTENVNLSESQKSLYSLLKLEIATLGETLTLPEDVKAMVESFLDYVMSNHHVPQEPATILQAFLLSLCWTAASILKYKLDHKDSVSLARRHLNFGCKKEDVEYVYSMLRCLKSVFLHRTGRLEAVDTPSTHLSFNEHNQDAANARSSHLSPASIIGHTVTAPHLGLPQKDFSKSIQDIEKKCSKQMNKLLEKQQKEKETVQCNYNDEKTQLEKKKITERAVIRCHRKGAMEANQLRLLEDKYAEKYDNLKSQMETRLKHLEERHVAAREQLLERKSHLIEGLKSWAQVELVNKPMEKDPENAISQLSCSKNQVSEGTSLPDGQEPLKDLSEGCTSTSGNIAPAQVDDDDAGSKDQHILLAVPSGNPVEISQPNTTTCITIPDSPLLGLSLQNVKHMSGELKADQCKQQDINNNCQFSAETSEVSLQIKEAPLEGVETTATAVMEDDLGRENLGVSLVSSSGCSGQANGITSEVPEVPSQVPKVPATFQEIATDVVVNDVDGENNGDVVVQLHCGSSEPADMVPSQVPEVPSKLPEIATDVIVDDITARENTDDAVVQSHCGSRCDEAAGVVLSQVPEVFSTLLEIATDVVVDINAGRENDGDAVVQDHRGSGYDEPANIAQSQVTETSNEIQEGEINVGRVAEVSAILSGGVRVSNQSDELPSDCNLHRGHSQANSPTLLPVVASAEENGMPSSQGLREECDQPVQVGCDLDTSSQLPMEVIDTPLESSHQSVSELLSSISEQHPDGITTNQPDLQVPDTRTSLNTEIGDLFIQATDAARMLATLSPDPLLNELEIIKKVKEESTKILQNTKLQLKSDCEKEIEVEVVKIRRKYEVKHQETESAVLLKNKELDAKHLKVLKSKMVAEVCVSKGTDDIVGASNPTSTQQGMGPPTSMSPADPGSVQLTMPNGHHASTPQTAISPREVVYLLDDE